MATKTDKYQVGNSLTPSQNFVIKTGSDGTLTIARGNLAAELGDVIKFAADGSVNGPFLGSGQTWQNMSASRTHTTDYTNNTGKPIAVYIQNICNNTSSACTFSVNGVTVGYVQGTVTAGVAYGANFIVPAGGVYRMDYSGSVNGPTVWSELR